MDCPRCGAELAIKELEDGRVEAVCPNKCYVFEAENLKTLRKGIDRIKAVMEWKKDNNFCAVCESPKELCICGWVCAGCKEHPNKCKCEELYGERSLNENTKPTS